MSEFNFDPYRRYGGGMAPMAPQSRYVLPSYIERTAYGVK
ncbi:MAG UNVERIFIED_CONTAM: ATP-dependent Clp protease proteolytic subunit, partial [Thermobifida fusca]